MFGDLASYASTDFDQSSDEYNAKVDRAVKKILDVSGVYLDKIHITDWLSMFSIQESYERVVNVLQTKDKELRRLSKALYEQDYLNAEEIDKVIRNVGLGKEKEENKVRTWDKEDKYGPAMIQF